MITHEYIGGKRVPLQSPITVTRISRRLIWSDGSAYVYGERYWLNGSPTQWVIFTCRGRNIYQHGEAGVNRLAKPALMQFLRDNP